MDSEQIPFHVTSAVEYFTIQDKIKKEGLVKIWISRITRRTPARLLLAELWKVFSSFTIENPLLKTLRTMMTWYQLVVDLWLSFSTRFQCFPTFWQSRTRITSHVQYQNFPFPTFSPWDSVLKLIKKCVSLGWPIHSNIANSDHCTG